MKLITRALDLTSISIGMFKIFRKAVGMQLSSDSKLVNLIRSKPVIPSAQDITQTLIRPKPSSRDTHDLNQKRSFRTVAVLKTAKVPAARPVDEHSDASHDSSSTSSLIKEGPLELHPDRVEEARNTPLRASRVPSSRLGRLFHYGGLAAGIGWGTATEAVKRATSGAQDDSYPLVLSETNVRRLVDKLTKMRGAALKLGQFMSIQDAKVLPPQIEQVFIKVQSTADYMPFDQAENVLKGALGNHWHDNFTSFTQIPIAAASIGQVHAATITEPDKGPIKVAVKVQFPGVFESIQSDLSYLNILANTSFILPKGLFLNKSIQVLGQELKEECDYTREALYGSKIGEFLKNDERFKVPRTFDHLSTKMVLTNEFMSGSSLKHAPKWSQSLRNKIGHSVFELCLREILHFRLMQTDPNWSNFLWNESSQQIELIDFGATREYGEAFIKGYLRLLRAGIDGDRNECIDASIALGYLTGNECETMLDSQYKTVNALGEPFRATTDQPYDFAKQTVTDRVRAEIPTMVRLRLKPPPIETYSLNRKLSGMFLLCNRLGSQIDCHRLLENLLIEKGPRS